MKHLVITVHGIRTFGGWQERLEGLLRDRAADRDLTVVSFKYGFFSTVAFMIPFVRLLVVKRFRKYFVAIATGNKWDRIDLVGHSFGTHVIAWGLRRINSARRPPVNTIILAGSVLKTNFPWQDVIGRSVKRVINDCGTKDGILVLNQIVILGTGMAGRLGFNGGIADNFRNRYFECGHSGYFLTAKQPDDSFMKDYWVPLLLTDQPPKLFDARKSGALGGVALWLLNNSDPVKLIASLVPFVALSWYFYELKNEAVTQRNYAEVQHQQAESNLQETQRLLVQFSDLVAERIKPIASLDEVDQLIGQATSLIGPSQRNDPGIAIPYAGMLLTEADIKWERRRTQEMYGLATQAATALAQSDQTKPEVQYLLARIDNVLGQYYATIGATEPDPQKTHADLEKARTSYDSALKRLAQLKDRFDKTSDSGNDWRWLRTLAEVHSATGDLLLTKFGDADQAKDYYQKSLDTWTKVSSIRPDDPEVAYQLDWAEDKVGDVLWAQGQDASALREFEKAERQIRALMDRFDVDQKWLHFLAIVQNNIAINRIALGQYKDALDALQRAEANLKKLLSHDAEQHNWLSSLAWTYDNMGDARVRWARKERDANLLTGADVVLGQAILYRAQLAQATDDPRWKVEPAISRANLASYEGTKAELAHDCATAADDYVRAAAINPATVQDEREDTMILRKAEFLEWAAIDYRSAGDAADADDRLREALAAIDNHTLRFPGRGKIFAAEKQQLEQDLQASAQSIAGVCN